MKYLITIITLISLSSTHAAVNLTPIVAEYEEIGVKFQRLIFQQEKGQITYEAPSGWTHHGGVDRVRFSPLKAVQAEAEIQQLPLSMPRPLDEACMQELTSRALEAAPAGGDKVALAGFEENPVLIDGHATFEVIISYQAYGHAFKKSMLFLHLPDTQIIFKLTARKDDFETLHKQFRRSLFTWHWK